MMMRTMAAISAPMIYPMWFPVGSGWEKEEEITLDKSASAFAPH